jgi:hypothetical protein
LNPIYKIENTQLVADNKENTLSINVRIDGFSFIVSNSGNIIKGEAYEWQAKDWSLTNTKIAEILNSVTVFNNSFARVVCIFNGADNCLIPNEFYSKRDEKSALETYLGKNNFEVFSSKLKAMPAHLVFGIEKTLFSLISKKFSNVIALSSSALNIDTALKEVDKRPTIKLKIVKQEFEVIALSDGKLIAHNFFQFQTADEFMFLLLSFVQQNSFNPETVHLKVKGKLLRDSKIGLKLDKYFKNIELEKTIDNKEAAFTTLLNYTQLANN